MRDSPSRPNVSMRNSNMDNVRINKILLEVKTCPKDLRKSKIEQLLKRALMELRAIRKDTRKLRENLRGRS